MISVTIDAETLRASFDLVTTREPELAARFYENLFTRYPESKALFGNNVGRRQEKMLRDALTALMENLENPSWLDGNLRALGERHVKYGVEEHMYGWVGACLLCTIAEISGESWTVELEDAWTNAFDAITYIMRAGAAAADS